MKHALHIQFVAVSVLAIILIAPFAALADGTFDNEFEARLHRTQNCPNGQGSITPTPNGQYVVVCQGSSAPVPPAPTLPNTPSQNSNTQSQGPNSNTQSQGPNSNTQSQGPNSNTSAPGSPVTIQNPLGPNATIESFARDIISVLLVFVTPIIVLAYIFAGFKYVVSRGNPEEIQKATRWLLYISIGAVLALGAFVILSVIQNTIEAFRT